MKRIAAPSLLLSLVGSLAACSAIVNPDLHGLDPASRDGASSDGSVSGDSTSGRDVVVPDGTVTDVPGTDATHACSGSCDDGIPCTNDRCDTATGQCQHEASDALCPVGQTCTTDHGCAVQPCTGNAQCDDGDPCNGVETCSGGSCARGPAPNCDDGQLCNGVETCQSGHGCVSNPAAPCPVDACHTNARCNPAGNGNHGLCASDAVDADHDGHPAATVDGMTCPGGDDCDDGNAAVHPGATETCNSVDDNCNGAIDEGLSCGSTPPANDLCTGAVSVTLGTGSSTMTVMGTTDNAGNGVDSTCGRAGAPDVWYRVTWPANQDLVLEAAAATGSAMDPVMVVRDGCETANIACSDDGARNVTTSRIFVRARQYSTVSTRTLYVIVDTYMPGNSGAFTLRAATTAGAAGSCDGSHFELGAGGTLIATIPTRTGGQNGTCNMPGGPAGGLAYPEDIFQVSPTSPRQYTVQTYRVGAGAAPIVYARNNNCSGSELACATSGNTNFNVNSTALLFVDSPSMVTIGGSGADYLMVVQPQ